VSEHSPQRERRMDAQTRRVITARLPPAIATTPSSGQRFVG
jgi:hypothetical protein